MSALPVFETVLLERDGRRLTVTMNRPQVLNVFDAALHKEIIEALAFAGSLIAFALIELAVRTGLLDDYLLPPASQIRRKRHVS